MDEVAAGVEPLGDPPEPSPGDERLRLLFDSHPIAMAVWEPATGEIIAANDAALRQYGYSAREIRGLRLEQLVHPDDLPRLLAAVPRFSAGVNGAAPFRHLRRDGSVLDVEVSGHPIAWEGRDARLVMAVDVTERRLLEEQLRQAQKMEAIGRLAGGIAHDFNNILTAISGYTSLLLESLDDDDPRRADAEQIETSAKRAAALTQQLLAFSRGAMVQPSHVDVNDVVATAEPMIARLIGEHIEVTSTRRATRPWVVADRGQLEQLLVNLALNARDAMPDGGTLKIETEDLDPGTAWRQGLAAEGFLVLSVSDTGVGIADEDRERIFEPFYSTKGASAGTGLGLATVYATVRQAGGRIRLLSEPGRGTTFRIMLPVADPTAAGDSGRAAATPVSATGARILLVEDELSVRELVGRILSRAGHAVVAAADGEEGFRAGRDASPPVDLLVSDIVMPGMGGIELARALRAQRPDLPVVLMSGYSAEALGPGDAGFHLLAKPFSADELLDRVRSALAGGAEPAPRP